LNVAAASSGFNHGDLTDNAWEEIVASTTVPYRAVSFVPMINLAAATAVNIAVDVGQGGAGTEQVIGSWWVRTNTTESITADLGPRYIVKQIPIGARLAARKNSTADLTGTIIGWR
jgi:hypothetical protein